jgi:hypothetical protein
MCACPNCTDDYDPVCAGFGKYKKTFLSMCDLKRKACLLQVDFNFKAVGQCKGMIPIDTYRFQPLLHGRLLELLGASTQLAICSKSPYSIAISS